MRNKIENVVIFAENKIFIICNKFTHHRPSRKPFTSAIIQLSNKKIKENNNFQHVQKNINLYKTLLGINLYLYGQVHLQLTLFTDPFVFTLQISFIITYHNRTVFQGTLQVRVLKHTGNLIPCTMKIPAEIEKVNNTFLLCLESPAQDILQLITRSFYFTITSITIYTQLLQFGGQ